MHRRGGLRRGWWAAAAVASAAAACTSYDDATTTSVPSDGGADAAPDSAEVTRADAAAGEPRDGGAAEAALDQDACVPLDCSGTAVCDEFDRATAEGPSWGKTTASTMFPSSGDAGLETEPAQCNNALVAFMPTLGGTAEEQLLEHTIAETLDSLTAEMDIWIDSSAKDYPDDQNSLLLIVGDKDQAAAGSRFASLRYDKQGLSLYVRDDSLGVKRTVSIATRQWTHLKLHVDFSSDPEAGRVYVAVNGQPAVNEATATLARSNAPLSHYVVQIGVRNSNSAPAMTAKFDNVRLTRGKL